MWHFLILAPLAVVGLIWLLVLQNGRRKRFFESKGVLYLGEGNLRLLTNFVKGRSLQEDVVAQYGKIRDAGQKVGVSNDLGTTTLTVGDPEFLKSIYVKDFDHFSDRRKFILGKSDYVVKRMMFIRSGDIWRQLRAKLSPTFTTGKIKRMFRFFDVSGQKFVKFVESEIARSGSEEIELTEAYTKFAADIVASTTCGIDSQAFDQKEPSLFEVMGKGLGFQFGGIRLLKLFALVFLPQKITDFLNISVFPKENQDFFDHVIKDSIKQREVTGEKRDDFVQLMLEARAGTLKSDESDYGAFERDAILKDDGINSEAKSALPPGLLDDDGIVANCVLFIVAGVDTTQSLLMFCAYALASHPEIQKRLRAEVDTLLENNNNQFTYDGLNKLGYLDMIINETLRFYPSSPITDRCCTKDYKVPGTDFVLKKGDALTIPIYALHHDPEYFPEPEKFDPERFSVTNRSSINPYVYMPFGQGPRNCIGMRFALTEAKVVIAYLVHYFMIEPSEKMVTSMKYTTAAVLKPVGGMQLRLTKIHH